MSSLEIRGGRPLRGRVRVPGDKSISHRALLLAALANGTSRVSGLSDGDDVARTAGAVQALGAGVEGERIVGGRRRLTASAVPIYVGNSGTTMRLLAGLCATFPWLTVLTGDESLQRRPMDRVAEPLRLMGAFVDGPEHGRFPPLDVLGGHLAGIDYRLPVPSAQVKGAVLLAGLAAEGETVVRERVRTRAHTEEMLAACGADVEVSDDGLTTRLRASELHPFQMDVPGDPSQAAFWVVAACVTPGSEVVVEDVYVGPARAAFLDVLGRMGADVEVEVRDGARADIRARSGPLQGTEISGDEVPALIDEVPALAVAASLADGVTTVRDAAELRVKETDRITALAAALGGLGVRVEALPDGLVIAGGPRPRGGRAGAGGDHRMAMAMAVAGLASEGAVVVEGWEAVATSYPGFEQDLRSLLCA